MMTEEARRAGAGARRTLFPTTTVTHRGCNTALQKDQERWQPRKRIPPVWAVIAATIPCGCVCDLLRAMRVKAAAVKLERHGTPVRWTYSVQHTDTTLILRCGCDCCTTSPASALLHLFVLVC